MFKILISLFLSIILFTSCEKEVEAKLTAKTAHFTFKCDALEQSKEYPTANGYVGYNYPIEEGKGMIAINIKETTKDDAAEEVVMMMQNAEYEKFDFKGNEAMVENIEQDGAKGRSIIFYKGKKLYMFRIGAPSKEEFEVIYDKFYSTLELM